MKSNQELVVSNKLNRCIIGIRGQQADPEYPVDVWFDSLKSVANMLSVENQDLLKVISKHQPQTITELAELSGRAVSNLSRTLKCLEKNKLVRLEKVGNSQKVIRIYSSNNYLICMGL